MPLLPNVTEEATEIQNKTGFYIPPERLAVLMQTASKVLKQVTSINEFTVTYRESELILNMVLDNIKKIKGD